jgi:hypothetical protein
MGLVQGKFKEGTGKYKKTIKKDLGLLFLDF